MHLSALAVRRPVATTMLLLAVILLGVVAIPRLEVTLLPEVSAARIAVWVEYPDAAVEEIEESVVLPIEEALVTVPGVRGLRSDVISGGATITARLHPGVDAEVVSLGIRERLDTVRWVLPEGVERPIILGTEGTEGHDIVLALSIVDADTGDGAKDVAEGDGRTGGNLAAAADWAETVLAPRLEQIEGVARAEVVGAPQREIRVVPNPRLLEASGVAIRDIADALRDANLPASSGYLRRREIRYALEIETALTSAADVAEVVVARRGDRILRVKDLAEVQDAFEDAEGWSRLDGAPAVGILVSRESGANLVNMADEVRERLEEIRREFPRIDVAVIADSSPFVRQSISGIWQGAWLGGFLAFLVLVVFLRDRRSPFFLVAAIPVSVVPTFAILDLLGVSLNIMSLGGVALGAGMLVDNAIICLENIYRLRAEGMSGPRAASEGAREVGLPMLASTLTTCAVFVPLAWVPGRVGELFRDQAIAVSVSLLMSLVVALTLLPMLASRLAPAVIRPPRMPLYGTYHRILVRALERPVLTLAITAALVAAGMAVILGLPREMFPHMATENLELELSLPTGTDVAGTDRAAREVEAWLLSRPEVERVFTTVGAAGSFDPTAVERQGNRATVRARLGMDAVSRRERLVHDLLSTFEDRAGWALASVPDRPELVSIYAADAPTLTCEVVGQDAKTTENAARAIQERVASLVETSGHPLRLSAVDPAPRFRLVPREGAIERHDLDEEEVLDAVAAATSGLEATMLRRFDEEDPVVIRAPQWSDPAAGRVVAGGRVFPLRELYDVQAELASSRIVRENQARVAVIRWEGSLRDVEPVKTALTTAAAATSLPAGATIRFGGTYLEMRSTLAAILRAFILSAGLVLFILAAQYESIRLPLLVFAAIPMAAIGVALALLLTKGSVNVISATGAIILVGIVDNDAILKVDLLRRLRAQGEGVREAIFTASSQRYRPIIMTTATTVFALIPLFFGRGAELRAPMAATTIGGLLSATVLTLIVIPVLFQIAAGRQVAETEPSHTAARADASPARASESAITAQAGEP